VSIKNIGLGLNGLCFMLYVYNYMIKVTIQLLRTLSGCFLRVLIEKIKRTKNFCSTLQQLSFK